MSSFLNKRSALITITSCLLFGFFFISIHVDKNNVDFISKTGVIIPSLCRVTHDVLKARELNNTICINPAQHLVAELLEVDKYKSLKSIAAGCVDKPSGQRVAVIIVDSARDHFMERELIRQTWGSMSRYKEWSYITKFLVGQSDYCLNWTEQINQENDPNYKKTIRTEESLIEELEEFGDILIGRFADTYRNLTYKHLMGWKYVLDECPQAELIIKTDDDMFVDVPGILDYKSNEMKLQKDNSSYVPYDIYCHNWKGHPARCHDCNEGKWFTTLEEWPEETYPLFCLGNDYAITIDWLKKIYRIKDEGGFFWIDDIFIMGKLREIAEKREGKEAKLLNMKTTGLATDSRGNKGYVLGNCEDLSPTKFGMFVFLARNRVEFRMEMSCLWTRALRIANVTVPAI